MAYRSATSWAVSGLREAIAAVQERIQQVVMLLDELLVAALLHHVFHDARCHRLDGELSECSQYIRGSHGARPLDDFDQVRVSELLPVQGLGGRELEVGVRQKAFQEGKTELPRPGPSTVLVEGALALGEVAHGQIHEAVARPRVESHDGLGRRVGREPRPR